MGFSWQVYWSGLPFSSPVDHILSELCLICLGWPCMAWLIASLTYATLHHDRAVIHERDEGERGE